jgi:chaperonin GroES
LDGSLDEDKAWAQRSKRALISWFEEEEQMTEVATREIAGVSTAPVPHEPIGDRILVRPIPVKEVTEGGIFIPDQAKEKPFRGIVVAVGPGALLVDGRRAPMQVRLGDVVVYAKYAGTTIHYEHEDLQAMRENEAYIRELR